MNLVERLEVIQSLMDGAYTSFLVVDNTLVAFQKGQCKERDFSSGQMVECMKENLVKVFATVQALSHGEWISTLWQI